jgi:hypothetical protein
VGRVHPGLEVGLLDGEGGIAPLGFLGASLAASRLVSTNQETITRSIPKARPFPAKRGGAMPQVRGTVADTDIVCTGRGESFEMTGRGRPFSAPRAPTSRQPRKSPLEHRKGMKLKCPDSEHTSVGRVG